MIVAGTALVLAWLAQFSRYATADFVSLSSAVIAASIYLPIVFAISCLPVYLVWVELLNRRPGGLVAMGAILACSGAQPNLCCAGIFLEGWRGTSWECELRYKIKRPKWCESWGGFGRVCRDRSPGRFDGPGLCGREFGLPGHGDAAAVLLRDCGVYRYAVFDRRWIPMRRDRPCFRSQGHAGSHDLRRNHGYWLNHSAMECAAALVRGGAAGPLPGRYMDRSRLRSDNARGSLVSAAASK